MRSFTSLKNLEIVLGKFSIATKEVLHETEREVKLALLGLENRRHDKECQLRFLMENSDDREERRRTEYQLTEINESLRLVIYSRKKLEDQWKEYKRQADKLTVLVNNEDLKARLFLKEKMDQLQDYIATQGSEVSRLSSLSTSKFNTTNSSSTEAATVSLMDFLMRFLLPEGYIWISLDEIDQSEVHEDLAFKKISSARMEEGFHILKNEILPALKEDQSRGWQYFMDTRILREQHKKTT